ncbi:hypothetical protein AB6A40_002004 [Gnathostoma spinigerum]|uniref:Uncharacterized protein n=1 Tax=Gnathostoma spinigerum TaxID=75299 RepID=A0ABD6E6I9_9BILA
MQDYFTDLIANDTILFIQRHRRKHPLKPFLAVLSFPAPHGPEDPAPQYSHLFPNVETHRTESWNYAPNPDKQWLLQHTGRMEPIHVVFTDVLQRRRLQTLQSVDHSIQRLMNELRELGELSNTYIIYTSDHGYHLGQYGLVKGKNMPYEFDIRVPYFIRGPGIPRNLTIRNPVLNIDIAPTILDMAGVDQPDFMDGRSLLPLIHEQGRTQGKHQRAVRRSKTPVEWRDTVLIERGKMAKLTRIRERWQKQRDQYGKSARLQHACAQPEFQKLCVEDQQWKCVRDHVGKWRIFKCQEDLQIDEECECRPERHEKRQKYHPLLPRRKRAVVSLRRIATTAELDEEGKNVTVDEELLRRWEKEFIFFLQQKEIIESGQWFQGVFDGQNRSSTNYRIRRSQRVTRKEKPKSVSIGSLCTRFNSSISCDAVVFESAHLWTVHKNKLDDRIENLRKRLSAYKDIRRQLKKSRPGGDFERTNVANDGSSKECNCWPPRAHSLQYVTQRMLLNAVHLCSAIHGYREQLGSASRSQSCLNTISARLISNNASFQKYRNKESNHGRRREHRRKPYEISPRRWLREGTRTNCNVPQMNCFVHGADHWRTPPLWPAVYGEFCFCQNSNNNTYWCLRTVNATHNFLYCEFITEFISFYDLSSDPNQLQNSVWSLSVGVLEQLSDQLQLLRTCRGREQCEHYSHRLWNTPFEQVHRLSNS